MRHALSKHPEIGFTNKPYTYRSRRVKVEKISDADFADDIALKVHSVKEAETLMQELERVAATVELRMKGNQIHFSDHRESRYHQVPG